MVRPIIFATFVFMIGLHFSSARVQSNERDEPFAASEALAESTRPIGSKINTAPLFRRTVRRHAPGGCGPGLIPGTNNSEHSGTSVKSQQVYFPYFRGRLG